MKFGLCKADRPMLRRIFDITWPAFLELVMSTLFGMVDMVMLGRLSPVAIAAAGLTNQPFMLLMAVFAAVNVGGTALVSWCVGAKNMDHARSVTGQLISVNFLIGLVVTVIGYFSADLVVTFMGAQPDTKPLAIEYFQIVAFGLLFQAVTMAVTAALRGAGETKLPMVYNLGSNLLNIFGNYVLIFGKWGFPQMGVSGAALSTTIARGLACLAALTIVFFTRHTVLRIKPKNCLRFNREDIAKVFRIGLPSALEQFVLQGGFILFARTVSGLGTYAFAAHQIGINICGLTFSPSQAFGVAGTTLAGQSIGAGDYDLAEHYAKRIRQMAMATACFVGLMFLLFSYPIALLYTTEIPVALLSSQVIKLMALAQPGQSTQLTIAGILRGAGDTMYPLYASIAGVWVFRVIFAWLFVNVFHWGLMGAWVSILLDQYTRSAIVYLRFRSGKWKYLKIAKPGAENLADTKSAGKTEEVRKAANAE